MIFLRKGRKAQRFFKKTLRRCSFAFFALNYCLYFLYIYDKILLHLERIALTYRVGKKHLYLYNLSKPDSFNKALGNSAVWWESVRSV
jgi:hypothetical protein